MSTDSAQKDMHIARYNMYKFCRNLFEMMPEEDFYKMLNEMVPHLKTFIEDDNKFLQDGAKGIISFIENYNKLSGKDKTDYEDDVSRAYTSVLCIPGVAPQIESIYTSSEGLTGQESCDEMKELLNKYSLEISQSLNQDYDHLFTELAFMEFLIKSSYGTECDSALKGLLEEQLAMHKEHFDKWIYSFLTKVEEFPYPNVSLYASISQFVRGFLQEDKAYLEEELS